MKNKHYIYKALRGRKKEGSIPHGRTLPKNHKNIMFECCKYREWDSNPHGCNSQQILNLSRLTHSVIPATSISKEIVAS